MQAFSGDCSFCYAGVDGMILTCQGSSSGHVCDGRSMTCPCSCGCYASGNKNFYDERVSLMEQFFRAVLSKMAKAIAVVALCLRRVVTNMTFPATNKAGVIMFTMGGVIKQL